MELRIHKKDQSKVQEIISELGFSSALTGDVFSVNTDGFGLGLFLELEDIGISYMSTDDGVRSVFMPDHGSYEEDVDEEFPEVLEKFEEYLRS